MFWRCRDNSELQQTKILVCISPPKALLYVCTRLDASLMLKLTTEGEERGEKLCQDRQFLDWLLQRLDVSYFRLVMFMTHRLNEVKRSTLCCPERMSQQ